MIHGKQETINQRGGHNSPTQNNPQNSLTLPRHATHSMLYLSTSPPRPPLLPGIPPLSAATTTAITTITPSMMAAAAVSLSPLFRPKLVPNHYRVPSRSRIGRRHWGGVVSVSRSVLNGVAAAGGGSGSVDGFRHPVDRQNTLILRAIPGLNEVGKALLGSMAEQVLLLENIGTSVLVSKDQGMD